MRRTTTVTSDELSESTFGKIGGFQRNISSHTSPDQNLSSNEYTDSEIFILQTKVHHRTGKPIFIKHLVLKDFKRIECPKKNAPHNHKSCYYFHSIKDKRRDDDLYTPELCKFADTEKCPKKDKCRRAHNRVERLYHKDKYKTKFCHCYPNKIQQCEYGDYCSFAHSVEDIKVRLIHHLLPSNQDYDFYIFYFKTEWCPYNHEHNKAQCVYAHNFQDFRRKPNLFRYDTELCEDWQSGTFITCYEEGCKRLEKCSFSHGWKEQQFHPLVYKTQPCEEQKCFKGFECPFYHSNKDKRASGNLNSSITGGTRSSSDSLNQQSSNSSQKDTAKAGLTSNQFEKLFIPKERNFKCPQQPNLMELYFDNNLNHVREQQISRENAQTDQECVRKTYQKVSKDIDQEKQESLDSSFEVKHISCTCPKQEKQTSQKEAQQQDIIKLTNQRNQESYQQTPSSSTVKHKHSSDKHQSDPNYQKQERFVFKVQDENPSEFEISKINFRKVVEDEDDIQNQSLEQPIQVQGQQSQQAQISSGRQIQHIREKPMTGVLNSDSPINYVPMSPQQHLNNAPYFKPNSYIQQQPLQMSNQRFQTPMSLNQQSLQNQFQQYQSQRNQPLQNILTPQQENQNSSRGLNKQAQCFYPSQQQHHTKHATHNQISMDEFTAMSQQQHHYNNSQQPSNLSSAQYAQYHPPQMQSPPPGLIHPSLQQTLNQEHNQLFSTPQQQAHQRQLQSLNFLPLGSGGQQYRQPQNHQYLYESPSPNMNAHNQQYKNMMNMMNQKSMNDYWLDETSRTHLQHSTNKNQSFSHYDMNQMSLNNKTYQPRYNPQTQEEINNNQAIQNRIIQRRLTFEQMNQINPLQKALYSLSSSNQPGLSEQQILQQQQHQSKYASTYQEMIEAQEIENRKRERWLKMVQDEEIFNVQLRKQFGANLNIIDEDKNNMLRTSPPANAYDQNLQQQQFIDSSYQEKLQNFAESYKKLNLDFDDIQEDDLESDYVINQLRIDEDPKVTDHESQNAVNEKEPPQHANINKQEILYESHSSQGMKPSANKIHQNFKSDTIYQHQHHQVGQDSGSAIRKDMSNLNNNSSGNYQAQNPLIQLEKPRDSSKQQLIRKQLAFDE